MRPRGGGTKQWGRPLEGEHLELSTLDLDRIVEHNAGDFTAVLEAGVPLARAQELFAAEGQMLALDPPLGPEERATVGGVVASADSGPLRSRYGGVRDLVVGITVALADGTLAKAGGKVIKNVAGYDLAKLFAGSFGTLGTVVEVAVRLHPLPGTTVTALGRTRDPETLQRGASALAHAPLEHVGLDVRWARGEGAVLARFAGAAPGAQAESALRALAAAGLEGDLVEEGEDELWQEQRAGQRSEAGTVVKVSGLQTELARAAAAAERLGGSLVGRGPLALWWIRLEDRSPQEAVSAVAALRRELAPSPCVVLDAPAEVRRTVDPWGSVDPPALDLMRRVKERFDPSGTCNPGVFVGGI